MKLVIHAEDRTPTERIVRLDLQHNSAGNIVLVVVDEHGEPVERGRLIEIGKDGRVRRIPNVNPHLGFDRDGHGRIRLRDEI